MWWGTGTSNLQLFSEMKECIALFDAPFKKMAIEYLTELYGSLDLSTDNNDIIQQVIRAYLPTLYKSTIDKLIKAH